MKKMMRLKACLALVLCFLFYSCDIFNPKKFADVIMVDGPIYEDADETFSMIGTVQNIGDGKALFVRVYIELRNPGNAFLAQASHLVDRTDLEPGESSPYRVSFEDADYNLRDLMDISLTRYDITWSEDH
jgi:hypothetical protein